MTRINQDKLQKELLARIENLETLTQRLEQAIFEIRNSCGCVGFEPDPGDFNCEPGCEKCGQIPCICDMIDPEEPKHECEDGCPSCCSIEEEPTEEDKDIDHDQ